MELWQAFILGLVEGVTEYLPVSSTGHLIIVSSLLGLDEPPETKHAVDAFNIVIQGGGILAVLGLYRQRVMQMLRGLFELDRVGGRLLRNLFLAFLPAAVIGLTLDNLLPLEALLFRPIPVMSALALGGLVMIFLGRWQRKFFHERVGHEPRDVHTFIDLEHLTARRALLIGLVQCIAIWPGTSRSMTTIVGGMVAGLRPREAAEFSFLLGLPTLGAACLYRVVKDFSSEGPNMFEVLSVPALIVGTVVAALSAAVAIRWLVGYLTRHGLVVFGWYRLVLCAGLVALWLAGIVEITP